MSAPRVISVPNLYPFVAPDWPQERSTGVYGNLVKPQCSSSRLKKHMGRGEKAEVCRACKNTWECRVTSYWRQVSAYHVPMAILHPRHNLLEEVASFVLHETPLLHNVVKQLPRLLQELHKS